MYFLSYSHKIHLETIDKDIFDNIRESDWIDEKTLVLFLDFTTYSPDTGYACSTRIAYEFTQCQ